MVRYLPCIYCNSVTAFETNQVAVCGTCHLLVEDQQTQEFQRSMREENEYWESNTSLADANQFEEQVRTEMEEDDQQLFMNRLRSNQNNELFRSVYINQDHTREELELYENDQDDFDFNMSYQANVDAIRQSISTVQQSLESTYHDYSAIALRLQRIIDGIEDTSMGVVKGVAESDIAALKTRRSDINASEANIECSICTENFDDLLITQLPCQHEYHSECIGYWLRLKDSCPICRQPISSTPPIMQEMTEEVEPDMIVITSNTADRIRQNRLESFMDDVD